MYLVNHLVLEKFLLVENLDGDVLPAFHVPSELYLGEIALAQGPTQLVFPHTGPTAPAAALTRPWRHLCSSCAFLFATILLLSPLLLSLLISTPLLLQWLPHARLRHLHLPCPFLFAINRRNRWIWQIQSRRFKRKEVGESLTVGSKEDSIICRESEERKISERKTKIKWSFRGNQKPLVKYFLSRW